MLALSFTLLFVAAVSAIDPRVASIVGKSGQPSADRCPEINPAGGSAANVDYYNGQPGACKPINSIDKDGSCKSSMKIKGDGCAGYCEIRVFFFYGHEIPLAPAAKCSQGLTCAIMATQSSTVTNTFEFNVKAGISKREWGILTDEERNATSSIIETQKDKGVVAMLKGAFDVGASYSYSNSKTKLTGLTLTRPTQNNASDCGYFTIIPVMMTSCGTI